MKRLLTTSCTNTSFNLAVFAIRVTFGVLLLLNHGIAKLKSYGSLQEKFFDPFHISHQGSLLLVLFAEVFCAAFVIIGLFTRLAAIPIVIELLVAVFFFHKGQPVSNFEPAILFLAGFTAILFMGSGKYSLDGALGK